MGIQDAISSSNATSGTKNHEEWMERLREGCRDVTHPRDGKDICIGTIWKEPHDIEVDMYRDNTGLPDRDVIRLYHQHGESGQYHSEFKTDYYARYDNIMLIHYLLYYS